MLVLNRRPGESIVIGDNIKITAIETSRAGVRLGIEAPRDIPVHREEIAERIANGEPMAPRPTQSPSYEALLIIVQAMCGGLERAGITDCDSPGEAIDLIRERAEKAEAALAQTTRRPALRQTRTYAELDVPSEFHAYVKQRLLDAGYDHAVSGDTIDMHGIALVLPR